MTAAEFSQLSTADQAAQWPALSVEDRTAIAEARRAASLATVPVSPRVVLEEARAASCYVALRRVLRGLAFVGYLASAGGVILGIDRLPNAGIGLAPSPWLPLLLGIIGPFIVAAALQSSLLLVDLVDFQLSQEARRRAGK